MKTLHLPINIELLVYYHSYANTHPRIDEFSYSDATRILLKAELIEPCVENRIEETREGVKRHRVNLLPHQLSINGVNSPFTTTDKGKAWMKILCNAEAPRQVYVDKDGNVL